jgi:hypothetical protein
MQKPSRIAPFYSFYSLALLLTGAVVIAGGHAGCSQQPPRITIEGQYAALSPVLLGVGSVFMKINNGGGKDTLVGAAANIPNTVAELHDIKNGRMGKVERITVPARGAVELKPRGLHIMVFNLPGSVREGVEISVTLRFEKSGEMRVPVSFVKPPQAQAHNR